jgi:cobaltochelatase CobN
MMNIVYIYGHFINTATWSQATELLKEDGINVRFFSQRQNAPEAIDYLKDRGADILIAQLFHDLPCHGELIDASAGVRHRLGLGWEMPAGFTTYSEWEKSAFERYSGILVKNYYNSIRYLVSCSGTAIAYEKPESAVTHGVYHPDAPSGSFASLEDYCKWQAARDEGMKDRPLAGILCYYGQIMEKNCAEIDAVIRGLERHGILPLCVYAEGMVGGTVPIEERYAWLPYFKEAGKKLSMILNLFGGRFLAKPEDASILEALNVPVIQLMRLYNQTFEEWEGDTGGLNAGASLVFSLAQPEISGVVEPTVIAASVPETDAVTGIAYRRYTPIEERIDLLCRRMNRWFALQRMPNS